MLGSIVVFDSKEREIASLPISGAVSRIGSSEICQLRIQGLPEVLATLQSIDGGFRLINKTASDLWLGESQVAPGTYAEWSHGESVNLGSQGRLQLVIGSRATSSRASFLSTNETIESEFDYHFPAEGSAGTSPGVPSPIRQEKKPQSVIASLLTIVACLAICAGGLYFVFNDSAPVPKSETIAFGTVMQKLEHAPASWKEPSQHWQVELQQCWLLLNRGGTMQARDRLLKLRESITNFRSTNKEDPTFDLDSLIRYIDQELAK